MRVLRRMWARHIPACLAATVLLTLGATAPVSSTPDTTNVTTVHTHIGNH